MARGGIAKQVPLSTTRSIELRAEQSALGTNQVLNVKIAIGATDSQPLSARTPGLSLSCATAYCDGVYPVEVALVDKIEGTALASFVTHLIYLAKPEDSIPLRVGSGAPARREYQP